MNASITQSLAILAVAAGFATLAMPAQADPSTTIEIRKLDLSKPEVAAVLYGRIRIAAQVVCRDGGAPWDARSLASFRHCVTDTVAQVVAEINAPQLTALHRARTESDLVSASND